MTTTSLIIIETIRNKLLQPVLDLVRFAETLSSGEPAESMMVMAGRDIHGPATLTAETTGINILTLEDPRFLLPNPELLSTGLLEIIQEASPSYICLSHTPRGCMTAAKLSKTLRASLITGVESLYHKEDTPVFRRAIFGGKFVMDINPKERPVILTVMPGVANDRKPSVPPETPGSVTKKHLPDHCMEPDDASGFMPVELKSVEDSDNTLEEADIIVSAGKGIGNAGNIDMVRKVASLLKNAAVGASRIACDMGWLSHSKQIGETGKRVAPKLYLACGISGSAQHVAGIKNAQTIIAINKDPGAAIFSVSDYGIVEDLNIFLPLLIDKLQQD
jgi:electron transfer flavoprotein alpha subunit